MRNRIRTPSMLKPLAGPVLAGLLVPAVAWSDSGAGADEAQKPSKVETAPDDTWITVSGRVVKVSPEQIRLDYGSGKITVEVEDFDSYGEASVLMENDKVVVRGIVDDDTFERRTIEASSVYVEGLQTYFYANPADEEDFAAWTVTTPVAVGEVEMTGNVTRVIGREFTIDTGVSKMQVDTVGLGYNPLDEDGYLKIEKGDRVKVGGDFDNAVFDETELSADWLIELQD